MFDVFYFTKPTALFPHERHVDTLEQARDLCRTEYFWIVNYLIDYQNFDWLWRPNRHQSRQQHVWPSQHQRDSGHWLVPRVHCQDINYHSDCTLTTRADLDLWQIPKHIDPESFDFTWHPDHSEQPWIYQFGTQWQRTGGPRFVVQGATHVRYVGDRRSRMKSTADVMVMIDHHNSESSAVYQQLQCHWPNCQRVRYVDNYLGTLKRIAQQYQDSETFVWVVSSICDYTNWDFTWHPSSWQTQQLHVFASGSQKFGDTFFMNTRAFADRMNTAVDLQDFDCNFVCDLTVPRLPWPVITHQEDSQVLPVVTREFAGPAAVFSDRPTVESVPDMCFWTNQHKTIVPLTRSGSSVLVPRAAVAYVKTQLWDYPHIDLNHQQDLDTALDVIYISNGEPQAEENYQWLIKVLQSKSNRVARIQNVKGRVAAYHAALSASHTAWAFCVFAKLRVNPDFDWSWQPDRCRLPKHYIFHARNPINGLEYGHQAMIAYNRALALKNPGRGLDFTLDQSHDVVACLSGIADFVSDPWTVWRTAFREALKLRYINDSESLDRLQTWCHVDLIGNHISKYSVLGACDALAYHDSVQGDFAELKKSYEWAWLAKHALDIGRLTTQDMI